MSYSSEGRVVMLSSKMLNSLVLHSWNSLLMNFSFPTIITDNYFFTIKYVKFVIIESFENVRSSKLMDMI